MVSNYETSEKAIIDAARSYLGVPFKHQGRSALGLDCLGLLVCVARDCGLCYAGKPLSDADRTDYGHLPNSERLYLGLSSVLKRSSFPVAGGIVLLSVDKVARHLGIVAIYPGGGLSLIHAYAPARRVVEHRMDNEWQQRIYQCFTVHPQAWH